MKSSQPARRFYSILGIGWRSEGGPCRSANRQGIASWKLIQTMSAGVVWSDHAFIEWIDFPMPEKTHNESCREAASLL